VKKWAISKQDHKTEKAEEFGKRRDDTGTHTIQNFWAEAEYTKYNNAILQLFAKKMSIMVKNDVTKKSFGYPHSKIEIEILSGKDVADRGWNEMPKVSFSEEFLETARRIRDPNHPLIRTRMDEECGRIKQEDPELYHQIFVAHSFVDLAIRYPNPAGRAAFVMGTVRLAIDKKLYPIARYLTWLDYDNKNDPIDLMQRNSTMQILHLDKHYIQEILPDIAKVFERAVTCERTEKETFKKTMAEFRFKMAFVMPFCRGSAAIAEWYENAIYYHKKFNFLSYKKGTQLDLECFANPVLPLFQKKYDSFFEKDPATARKPS